MKDQTVPCIIGAASAQHRHFTPDVKYAHCDHHWLQLQRIRRENIARLHAYRLVVASDMKRAVGMLARHFSG